MQVYEATPEQHPRGAVLVVHDGFGIGPSIRAMCDILAGEGWHVACPQMFHRTGHLTVEKTSDLGILGEVLERDEHVLADIDTTLAHLASRGLTPDKISVIGFCWGGRGAFLGALHRPFASAVSLYGTGIVEPLLLPGVTYSAEQVALLDEVAGLQSPWLGIFAGDDVFVPVEHVERLRARLDKESPVEHELHLYEGQAHGFVHHGVGSLADISGSAMAAWSRTVAFLAAHI
ncbi:dienelactone hydrolase family protein [Dactylosporangium sp. NPDC051485]|uniref:dienelactone hydrolase family protein n=1 Tax=Dactylosporangium sp. NPDC051485 TaxID=3154846 RepID=UPI00342F83CE